MINNIVLAILGISTIIQVLEMCGFLPKKVLRWFTKNRCYETLEALKEFRINTDIYRSKNATVAMEMVFCTMETTRCRYYPLPIRR